MYGTCYILPNVRRGSRSGSTGSIALHFYPKREERLLTIVCRPRRPILFHRGKGFPREGESNADSSPVYEKFGFALCRPDVRGPQVGDPGAGRPDCFFTGERHGPEGLVA